MSQQKEAECFTCHQKIYISKPTPDSKWVKTNLDGSAHIDPFQKFGTVRTQTVPPLQQPQQPSASSQTEFDSGQTIRRELNKGLDETIKLRDKTIQESFDRKMEAYDEITSKLDKLSASVERHSGFIEAQTVATVNLAAVLQRVLDIVQQWVEMNRQK